MNSAMRIRNMVSISIRWFESGLDPQGQRPRDFSFQFANGSRPGHAGHFSQREEHPAIHRRLVLRLRSGAMLNSESAPGAGTAPQCRSSMNTSFGNPDLLYK